jgi:PiT family inorganic phosphate transporter
MTVGSRTSCQERYNGQLLGINASTVLDALHYLSGGIVSLARGQARWQTIAGILAAWVTTLPVAALLGAVIFLLLRRMFG